MGEQPPELRYDGGDLAAWRRKLRRRVRQCLGVDRMPREKTGLNPRQLWRMPHELGVIEKHVFTAEPGADVPCYLGLPSNAEPPYPVFICLQGHSGGDYNSIAVSPDDERTPIDVEGDRDFVLGCMRRGVAALSIEQRAFGQRRERRQSRRWEHGCIDAAMHAMMLGRSLAGERVYDVDRAIDFLAQRDEVDLNRLGVMGNSGGGTITTYAAAVLPRIKLAMPSCAFCTYRDSIMSIQHCPDNYVPGMLAYAEMGDVLGLFAPRPVVVVAGRDDDIFPMHGVRSAFDQLEAIYRAAGAADRCRLVVGEGGHRFYAEPAWDAMRRFL